MSRRDSTDLSPRTRKIPRSCSDVFRLWAAVGLGLVLGGAFEVGVDAVEALGWRQEPARRQVGSGSRIRESNWSPGTPSPSAICRSGSAPSVVVSGPSWSAESWARRLPKSRLKRYLLAGGSGPTWAVLITIFATSTIVTAAQQRESSTGLVFGLIVVTVITSLGDRHVQLRAALRATRHRDRRAGVPGRRRAGVLRLPVPGHQLLGDVRHHRHRHHDHGDAPHGQRAWHHRVLPEHRDRSRCCCPCSSDVAQAGTRTITACGTISASIVRKSPSTSPSSWKFSRALSSGSRRLGPRGSRSGPPSGRGG